MDAREFIGRRNSTLTFDGRTSVETIGIPGWTPIRSASIGGSRV
jgi:hypothetical protein